MKKILIVLLIVGLLVGAYCTAVLGDSFDGNLSGEYKNGDPSPCGGGGGTGDGGHPGSSPSGGGGGTGDGGHPG